MKPLEEIRILAVSQYGAGPCATLLLADLGAEIIKIEDPSSQGDISRRVVPYAADGDSLFFQAFNRNKQSITLNLKDARGVDLLRRLVEKSDAVFNNLRGDVPAKLGLTYKDLKSVNPQIVCCSLSGFGTSGLMQAEPAYDYLLQAMLGHMSLTGSPGGPPEKYGLSMIDFSTGIMAALGLMAGIHKARASGEGCDVDVSLFDTAASLLNYIAAWNLNKGYVPEKTPWSAHPSLVPSQMFPTRDGYIVVMCNKEKFFPLLCTALEAFDLAQDPRYINFTVRRQNKACLISRLTEIFQTRDTNYWLERFKGKIPAAPVNTVDEALRHPLLREREMIVEVDHPSMGRVRMMGNPIKISGHQTDYQRGPRLGEHNQWIYGDMLGLDQDALDDLQQQGVI